jgi:hypothetical protein
MVILAKHICLGFEVLALFYEDSSSVELLNSVGIRMSVSLLDILFLQKILHLSCNIKDLSLF